MKLAGILARSAGYPLDDPPVMVWSALHQALATCKRYGVEPVGAFEMAMTETWDGTDQALRWEFVPTNGVEQPPRSAKLTSWRQPASP